MPGRLRGLRQPGSAQAHRARCAQLHQTASRKRTCFTIQFVEIHAWLPFAAAARASAARRSFRNSLQRRDAGARRMKCRESSVRVGNAAGCVKAGHVENRAAAPRTGAYDLCFCHDNSCLTHTAHPRQLRSPITPIGFGAWAIGGGDWQYGWGAQDDNDSIAAIHRALDLGINWIDTAAVYGLGHSEEVVGRAVKSSVAQALHLHQMLHALACRPQHLQLAQGRIAGRRGGRLAAPAASGSHRPLPDSLAQSRRARSKRDGRR